MPLPPLKFTVLDTETTGFVPKVHKVIEFASMRLDATGKVVQEYEQLTYAPEIPPVVEIITRIKTPDLKGKPPFEEKREEIMSAIGEDTLIVGQNVGFDIGMLKGEGIDLGERPWIDTSMLASLVFPELESYSLGYLSEVLHLNHAPKHRALGDVRATLELLEKCWERLLELPEELLAPAREIMRRSSPGYRMLFEALPPSQKTERPSWLTALREARAKENHPITLTVDLSPPARSEIVLVEEPLDPSFLRQVIDHARSHEAQTHWVAVKNLEASLQHLPRLPEDTRVIYPTFLLLDAEATTQFLAQETYTADEATLAVKLHWYEPSHRAELPIHGGEEAVWSGKLACTPESFTYLSQFQNTPRVVVMDHRQLLMLFKERPSELAYVMQDVHVIIDDSSMLEDTASRAFGEECSIDALRAAAAGNDLLTRFVDVLQLWIEKVRGGQDLRYLTAQDLSHPDTKGVRQLLQEVMAQPWSTQVQSHLRAIAFMLEPQNLADRITYIEQRMSGSQYLYSVPEHVGKLLQRELFDRARTTLLVPAFASETLRELVPGNVTVHQRMAEGSPCRVTINLLAEPSIDAILNNPPEGKTIILISSKGTIENFYVKYTEQLEEAGTTLICQGVSGGQGRMQAEFLAAKAPVIWLLTPWSFEGIQLPPESVDHLIIQALPFDHPSHPVLSKRAAKYRNAFEEYNLPRLMHRLFRLLRTFCRFKTDHADIRILDERLHSKNYGQKLKAYLERFGEVSGEQSVTAKPRSIKKPMEIPKKEDEGTAGDQLKLF